MKAWELETDVVTERPKCGDCDKNGGCPSEPVPSPKPIVWN